MSKIIYEKMAEAIEAIKNTKMKKLGHNDYSNFDYWTPDQISKLVYDACKPTNLYPKFDLVRNELGIEGHLQVLNLENESEYLEWKMATDIPVIKATNIAQQLGGCMTFTKRYMLMNAFEITDNTLDFDSQKQDVKKPEPKKKVTPPPPPPKKVTLSAQGVDKILKLMANGEHAKAEKNIKYYQSGNRQMSSAHKMVLENALRNAKNKKKNSSNK